MYRSFAIPFICRSQATDAELEQARKPNEVGERKVLRLQSSFESILDLDYDFVKQVWTMYELIFDFDFWVFGFRISSEVIPTPVRSLPERTPENGGQVPIGGMTKRQAWCINSLFDQKSNRVFFHPELSPLCHPGSSTCAELQKLA